MVDRICIKCGETKPEEEFHYKKTCTKCHKEWTKKYYLKNKEKLIQYSKKYVSNNRNRTNENRRRYDKTEKGQAVKKKSRINYKINHRDKIRLKSKEKSKRRVGLLKNQYVIRVLKINSGLSKDTIMTYPELIENQRQQIKIKRLIKLKHENVKAS